MLFFLCQRIAKNRMLFTPPAVHPAKAPLIKPDKTAS
jgi:hypothetical protein